MSVASAMRDALGEQTAAVDLDAPSPEETLAALAALSKPANIDKVGVLLRDLAGGLAGADRLAIELMKSKAATELERLSVKRGSSLIAGAFVAVEGVNDRCAKAPSGSAIDFPDPEPWPEPIVGDELLDELEGAIVRYLILPDGASVAVALWAAHTWTVDASPISPRIGAISPEKRCGKSTLLRILERLVRRPLNVSNVTAAAIFRTVEAYRPTLLIDEADSFLASSDELRGILNSGHERTGRVVRVVGDDFEPKAFSTFGPCALAAIGKLPGTLEDRSVLVAMRRKAPGETVERFRSDRTPDLDLLARKLARWSEDSIRRLRDADPEMPAELHDRGADNWRPLVAIADLAGGRWPAAARLAAIGLSGHGDLADASSLGEALLADIQPIIGGSPIISSQELCAALVALDDRPWAEVNRGRPINPHRLGRMLRPYGISSKQVRIGTDTLKGYRIEAFEDAFERYLGAPGGSTGSKAKQRNNPSGTRPSGDSQRETRPECFASETGRNPNGGEACFDVSLTSPESGEAEPDLFGDLDEAFV